MDQCPYMPYMQMMNMPSNYSPMMTMPQEDLESMYPKMYFIIFPVVKQCCDMMDMNYGTMYTPTKEHMEKMANDICLKVEADVELSIDKDYKDRDERQFGFGGRGLLRGLASILLIRELLRRRGYYGGYPGYYGGYPGYYGGYPGGGGFGVY